MVYVYCLLISWASVVTVNAVIVVALRSIIRKHGPAMVASFMRQVIPTYTSSDAGHTPATDADFHDISGSETHL